MTGVSEGQTAKGNQLVAGFLGWALSLVLVTLDADWKLLLPSISTVFPSEGRRQGCVPTLESQAFVPRMPRLDGHPSALPSFHRSGPFGAHGTTPTPC